MKGCSLKTENIGNRFGRVPGQYSLYTAPQLLGR